VIREEEWNPVFIRDWALMPEGYRDNLQEVSRKQLEYAKKLKHQQGKHNQNRHAWRYNKNVPLSRLRRQRKREDDPEEWEEYKRRVRKRGGRPPRKPKPKKVGNDTKSMNDKAKARYGNDGTSTAKQTNYALVLAEKPFYKYGHKENIKRNEAYFNNMRKKLVGEGYDENSVNDLFDNLATESSDWLSGLDHGKFSKKGVSTFIGDIRTGGQLRTFLDFKTDGSGATVDDYIKSRLGKKTKPKPKPAPKPKPKPKPRPKPAPKPTPKPKPAPKPKPKPTPPKKVIQGIPAGTPVSDGLNLNKLPKRGKYAPPVRDAINAINQVHGDGNLPEIPLSLNSSGRYHGAYSRSYFGKAVKIQISRKGDHPMMTTAHEIGHFLDHKGLKSSELYFSESPAGRNLMNVFENSNAIKSLRGMRGKTFEYTGFMGQQRTTTADDSYLSYLLKGREVFARAYAQYITTKSGSTAMMKELEKLLARPKEATVGYQTQWEPDDFKPIEKAFDDLFAEQGWIK